MNTAGIFFAGFAASAVALALLERLLPQDFLRAAVTGRSNHLHPVRQIGGLALAPVAVVAPMAAAADFPSTLALCLGAIALATLGFIDDRRDLPARIKLAAQILIAAPLSWLVAGSLPGATVVAGVLLAALILFGLLYWINAVNFMDGVDLMIVAGLGPGMVTLSLLALWGAPGDPAAIGALALAGGLAAFGFFNRPPARMFLGDSGSLVVGFVSGVAVVDGLSRLPPAAAVLPFLYFFADTTTTIVLRWRAGEKLLTAHSRHAYQVARRSGASVWSIIGRVVAITLALCGLSFIAYVQPSTVWQAATLAAGGAMAFGLVVHFRRTGKPGA